MRRLQCQDCSTTDSARVKRIEGKEHTLCKRCYCARTGAAIVPAVKCPGCGKVNDMASASHAKGEHHVPKEGEASICIQCGTLSVYDKQLRLTPMTVEQLAERTDEERAEIAKIQWAIRMMRAN